MYIPSCLFLISLQTHPINWNLCNTETGDCQHTQSEVGRIRAPVACHTYQNHLFQIHLCCWIWIVPACAKNIGGCISLDFLDFYKGQNTTSWRKSKRTAREHNSLHRLGEKGFCIPNSQCPVRNGKPTAQPFELPRHNPRSPAFN